MFFQAGFRRTMYVYPIGMLTENNGRVISIGHSESSDFRNRREIRRSSERVATRPSRGKVEQFHGEMDGKKGEKKIHRVQISSLRVLRAVVKWLTLGAQHYPFPRPFFRYDKEHATISISLLPLHSLTPLPFLLVVLVCQFPLSCVPHSSSFASCPTSSLHKVAFYFPLVRT